MALTYTQLDVHARKHYLPNLINNVFVGNPFLVKILANNQITVKGGLSVVQPILYGKHKGGSYAGLDRFDINPVDTRTLASWDWKNRYVNITMVGDDIDKCNDDSDLLDLLQSEVQGAELTIKDNLSEDLFSDGTGNNSKDFNGLDDGIGSGTYGGISPTDISTWTSTVDATGGAITIARVKGWMGECTYGTEIPDLILTTQALYDALWAQVQPNQRTLMENTILAKLGFTGIQIDSAQVLVDRHCPSGYMYGMNTKYWHMFIHPNKNFKWTSDKEMIDADGYVRQILLKGNFINTCRRFNFKAYSLTA